MPGRQQKKKFYLIILWTIKDWTAFLFFLNRTWQERDIENGQDAQTVCCFKVIKQTKKKSLNNDNTNPLLQKCIRFASTISALERFLSYQKGFGKSTTFYTGGEQKKRS